MIAGTRFRWRVSLWTIILVAALMNIGAYVWNWSYHLSWLDKILHTYTSFALTLVLALLLCRTVLSGRREHRLLLVLTIASVGLAFGVLWEIAEWAFERINDSQVMEDKTDTILDLAVDSVGSFIAALVSVRTLK